MSAVGRDGVPSDPVHPDQIDIWQAIAEVEAGQAGSTSVAEPTADGEAAEIGRPPSSGRSA